MRILFLLIFLYACEQPRRVTASYQGAVFDGGNYSCSPTTYKLVCENELEETRNFKRSCLNQNKKILQCDCDEYLCVDSLKGEDHSNSEPEIDEPESEISMGKILSDQNTIYTGIDFNGNTKSCSPLSPDLYCSQEFTQEDQYGFDCRENGQDIVFCSCHDPICL